MELGSCGPPISLKKKAPKRRVGYARVSTEAQDLTRQLKALRRVPCDVVFSDKASGKSLAGRPALAEALDELDEGDELVIAEWDRATRSMWDGLQIIKAVIDAKASVKVLDRNYRPRDTYGPGLHGDAVGARRRRTLAHHQAHP
jgi:DNA invertase Pin-like site-specific DNA recombinase